MEEKTFTNGKLNKEREEYYEKEKMKDQGLFYTEEIIIMIWTEY